MKSIYLALIVSLLLSDLGAQSINVTKQLKGVDEIINTILKDWNVPGAGVGVVVKDKLVFAKGYGYRDLEKKLPVTANTLFQIASNTKLFTATGIGLLVNKGELEWDLPIRNFVPQLEFYNEDLNKNVTIRDMLSHRTGISRHDFMWEGADFTREELFDRIKYLEPSLPLRQGYLYNNLMYIAAGRIIELKSGQVWEDYIQQTFFKPLEMSHSLFVTEEMQKQADYMKPYYEKRDGTLAPYPMYTKNVALSAAGSIISSITDMSHWLAAHMNGGMYKASQVIPTNIIHETMTPATIDSSVPDTNYETLNSIYGMGRRGMSYKGHYRVEHGGAIGGIYSLVSFMPADSIGIIVYINGDHASVLPVVIGNTIYDKLLNLTPTNWSERSLEGYKKRKEAARETLLKPDADRIANTKPSHAISDYAGEFVNPGYGTMRITEANGQLSFSFHTVTLPLHHYHYDRFVSEDDEVWGRWSFLFESDPQGSIQSVRLDLDEREVTFTRTADAALSNPSFMEKLSGIYTGLAGTITIELLETELIIQSSLQQHLVPYKGKMYRIKEYPDQTIEFVLDDKGFPIALNKIKDGKSTAYKKN